MTSIRSITSTQRLNRSSSADSAEPHYDVEVRQPQFSHDRSDAFFSATKARVQQYLRSHKYSRFGGAQLFKEGLIIAIFSLILYILVLFGNILTPVALLFSIFFGISTLLLALTLGHDAVHGTLVRNETINKIVSAVTFSLNGTDSFLWAVRHIKSHHVSPNVDKYDVDVSENGFVRLSPLQDRHWHHKYQHLYANVIYGFLNIQTFIYYDLRCLITKDLENTHINKLNLSIIGQFIIEKTIYITIIFVIPYLLMERPWWHIAIGGFIVSFVNSIIFSAMLIGTHHGEGIEYPTTNQKGLIAHGWAYHQVITAIDWLPSSKLANFISGGSNTHIAHHLFPNISHVHYVEITKIIKEEAEKFHIPYKEMGFFDMLISHYRHLKRMGAETAC